MTPLRFTLLSCSLDPESRSRRLAHLARARLEAQGHQVTLLDLRDHPLPAFDNDAVFESPAYATLHQGIREADGVFLAVPIYNWAVGGAAKHLIEATGATDGARRAAWFDQVVTFLCAGGLPHSYMAYTSLAASLMLDFKCVLNPYVVYASGRDWEGDDLSPALEARLDKTLRVKLELAQRLRGRTYTSDWEI